MSLRGECIQECRFFESCFAEPGFFQLPQSDGYPAFLYSWPNFWEFVEQPMCYVQNSSKLSEVKATIFNGEVYFSNPYHEGFLEYTASSEFDVDRSYSGQYEQEFVEGWCSDFSLFSNSLHEDDEWRCMKGSCTNREFSVGSSRSSKKCFEHSYECVEGTGSEFSCSCSAYEESGNKPITLFTGQKVILLADVVNAEKVIHSKLR